ncbi:MAG: IS630 transposase-related protein [Candidatus Caenarcaniphilales bacterium]|nr:IS630 transposase-related protein [Candidatus Caenarcaniphilales bacterium]
MTYGYSNDLRDKALSYYDRSGKSQEEVSEIFGISLRTFSNWINLRKKGDFNRRSNQKKKAAVKIDEAALKLYVQENSEAYLSEIGQHFGVSDVAILYALRRLNITRKKNKFIPGKRRKREKRISK